MSSARTMLAALALAALAPACMRAPRVSRVYDGRVAVGDYVSPDAYASFLRGVLAEESGDLRGARAAYEAARDEDSDDPLVWTRLGEVACKEGGAEGAARARSSFARALELDRAYAGALAGQARCALLAGEDAAALAAAQAAAHEDPASGEIAALFVRAAAKRPSPETRARAVALTLAHGERAAAWDALLAWARGHGDDELVARGLVGLAKLAPLRAREVEAGALDLLARGHVPLARDVAAAVADAPREAGHVGPRDEVVARLAVDEAVVRADGLSARRRAARGHVLLAEVAARAVALQQEALGVSVAREIAAADPGASGAAMVLAATEPERGAPVEPSARTTDLPPAICAFVLAERLARVAGVDVARSWLSRVPHAPAPARDPLASSLAVALTARGVIGPAPAPKEPRAELGHARAPVAARSTPPAPSRRPQGRARNP